MCWRNGWTLYIFCGRSQTVEHSNLAHQFCISVFKHSLLQNSLKPILSATMSYLFFERYPTPHTVWRAFLNADTVFEIANPKTVDNPNLYIKHWSAETNPNHQKLHEVLILPYTSIRFCSYINSNDTHDRLLGQIHVREKWKGTQQGTVHRHKQHWTHNTEERPT